MTPLAFLLYSYTGGWGRGLPSSWKEGYHVATTWEVDATFTSVWTVGSWMTIPVNDQGGPSGRIYRAGWGLFYRAWPFPSAAGWRRRRGSLILALESLLLRGWSGIGHKTTDCHWSSCHHVVTLVGFGFRRADWFNDRFLSYSNRSFRFNKGLKFYKNLWLNGDLRLNPLVCRKDTRSADSSRKGASSSKQAYHGPRSRASPTVSFGGRKFTFHTSI